MPIGQNTTSTKTTPAIPEDLISIVKFCEKVQTYRRTDNDFKLLMNFINKIKFARTLSALKLLITSPDANFIPNIVVCNQILTTLASLGHIEKAKLIFKTLEDKILKDYTLANTFTYTSMIQAATYAHQFEYAKQTFENACELEDKQKLELTDVVTYTTMIKAAGNAHEFDYAKQVFEKAYKKDTEKNFWPPLLADTITYSTMINVASNMHQYEYAKEIFEKARELTLTNVFTYATMIKAAADANRFDDAESIFKEACAHKLTGAYTYTAMIKAAANAGRFETAKKTFEEAREKDANQTSNNLHPLANTVTYNGMIDAADKAHKFEYAQQIFKEACDRGLADAITYTCMINAAANANRFDDVKSIFKDACNQRVADAFTYTAIIKAATNANKFKDAKQFFEKACSEDAKLRYSQPYQFIRLADTITYITMINAAANAREFEYAKQTFNKACSNGLVNAVTYASMIYAFTKAGDFKRARVIYQQAIERNMADPITKQIYLSTLVLEGSLREADELFNREFKIDFEQGTHDLHDHSYGSSYIYLKKVLSELEKCPVPKPTFLIIGKGLHFKQMNMLFNQREVEKAFEDIKKQHPNFSFVQDDRNMGLVSVRKMYPASEKAPSNKNSIRREERLIEEQKQNINNSQPNENGFPASQHDSQIGMTAAAAAAANTSSYSSSSSSNPALSLKARRRTTVPQSYDNAVIEDKANYLHKQEQLAQLKDIYTTKLPDKFTLWYQDNVVTKKRTGKTGILPRIEKQAKKGNYENASNKLDSLLLMLVAEWTPKLTKLSFISIKLALDKMISAQQAREPSLLPKGPENKASSIIQQSREPSLLPEGPENKASSIICPCPCSLI